MMGSGTAVLEALLLERKAVGFDIDPLAIRIASAKTTPLTIFEATSCFDQTIATARRLSENAKGMRAVISSRYSAKTREFFDYWFSSETQTELMALLLAIERQDSIPIRRFLEIVFSSIIVAKSGGVSLARDLAHSRPHRVLDKEQKSPIEKFASRGEKAIGLISNLPTTSLPPLLSYADA